MSKITLDLPLRYRIDLKLVKRRVAFDVDQKALIPNLKEVRTWRSGNKLSRLARHFFEHKKANRILGSNLAVAALATSMLPKIAPAYTNAYVADYTANINLSQAPLNIQTERGVQNPLPEMRINQSFFTYHPGVDLKGTIGDPIRPIMVGTVVAAETSRFGYGNSVLVDHGGGIESLYAHMSKILVKKGDKVQLETIIGLVGSTGHSTGPHLHLEVREAGVPTNPFRVLPKPSK